MMKARDRVNKSQKVAREQQTDAAPPEEPQQMDVDFPVLPADIQLGLFTTPDGAYAILNCSNVLVRGTFSLDRAQTIELGSQLIKLGRRMAKDKPRIVVPRPEGETERPSGLVLPGASADT